MSLGQYKKKRNFSNTPEPAESKVKADPQKIFVVQRHHASHLHYDFRLELQGALKSWAVPKGPSLNPADKRLAMRVEDHPVSYATFEGDIPEGNYGAGHVDIWDHGTYEPVDKNGKKISFRQFAKDLNEGSIKFILKGRKLKGEFALVNMKKDDKAWLLIKHRDKFATDEGYNSEDHAKKSSLAYTEKRLAAKKPGPEKHASATTLAVKKKPGQKIGMAANNGFVHAGKKLPHYIKPMLAKSTDKPFDNKDWIFEIKWDGYRAVAEVNEEDVKLYSRNGLSFVGAYADIVEALKKLKIKAVLDGEIVALNELDMPDFQALQYYDSKKAVLEYQVFDLLRWNGKSLEKLPLAERKNILKEVLPPSDSIIKYSGHIKENGTAFFEATKEKDLEGIIAKRADSFYYEGKRSGDWLKIKHHLTEEAIIIGYTKPRGGRNYFGALILATHENKKLRYIGHTGTGFSDRSLHELYDVMQSLVTDVSPLDEKIKVNAPVTWLKPELVCNVKYSQVTNDGIRRHPVFAGLRIDKNENEITMAEHSKSHIPKSGDEKEKKTAKASSVITHPEKLYWKKEGITKGVMIGYYKSIYKYIIPYLKDRPQSLNRFPNGIDGTSFYHKDAGENVPDFVDTFPVWSDSAGKTVDYIVCNNKPALQYIANLGCIELNPWNSRTVAPDKPDYLVMDLDPSSKNSFNDVIDCALVIKELFDRAKVNSYCKTSGATGLHIYVPLQAKYTYEEVRMFAELVAHHTVDKLPGITTLERSLKKRSDKKIYVDYLQNKQGATLCSVYSLRPKPGAPVSTPLDWKEVQHGLDPKDFNIHNTLARLEKRGDLFAPVLKKGMDMEKALKLLG